MNEEEKQLQLRFQLTKVDARKHTVAGIMVAEEDDKSGEMCDYETSKPYFKTWSDGFEKATDGKSLGNVREMHQPVAVGKLISLVFDDVAKAIHVEAEVVDAQAWAKCEAGVYTGFSIGGSYVKRWTDPVTHKRRYTADPAEVSLVDNPCVPSATFTAVKLDGSEEIRKFAEPAAGADLEKADEGGTTPLAAALEAMQDAAADHDPTVSVPVDILQKLHNDIVGLGAPCTGARWYSPSEIESLANDPDAYLKQQIHAQLVALGAQCPERVQRAADAGDLEKAGAAISAANMGKLQAIHDHAVGMGAKCAAEKVAAPAPEPAEQAADPEPEPAAVEVEKAATPNPVESPDFQALRDQVAELAGQLEKTAKIADQVVALQQQLAEATATRTELEKRIAHLEDQPAGPSPALTADAILAQGTVVEKALGAATPAATTAVVDDISRLEAIVNDGSQDPLLRQAAGRELAQLRKARGPLGR